MTGIQVKQAEATRKYTKSELIDAWCCSQCGGHTYDTSQFEVPRYCCRCGSRFTEINYKEIDKNA